MSLDEKFEVQWRELGLYPAPLFFSGVTIKKPTILVGFFVVTQNLVKLFADFLCIIL